MCPRSADDVRPPDPDATATPSDEAELAEAELLDANADTPEDHPDDEATEGRIQPEATDATLLPVPSADRAVDRADPLTRYMAELRRYPPISREEERELAIRWREHGDPDAGRRLVLANLRLVVKLAMEYRRAWANTLDLIQEGNVGLVQAVERFDPEAGAKLSTYAAYWIRAYILKYLIDNIRLVRVGSSRAQRKLFFRLGKEKRELERQGFEVQPKLLAERLDVSEQDVIDMEQRLSSSDLSMEAPVRGDEGDGASYGDFLAAPEPSVEDQVADTDLRRTFLEHVEAFAEGLGERERKIMNERVLAQEQRTLQELGDELGLTRERVRQLEKGIVDGLRDYLKDHVVDFEVYAPGDE
ncbi:MAG: RNA polymerase subunit sigma-70 [Deltaproteobacteria bacterium]|nr:RNA polymerase subunit sigma-70 [Deltaproteobacteria bacterium]